jgi:hypothetical protein
MRVNIEHREQVVGASGKGRNYFIDYRVQFSEEEKAIIQARALQDRVVIDAYLRPPPPPIFKSTPFWMRVSAPLVVLAGIIVVIRSLFTHSGEDLGGLLLLAGGGMWVFGALGVSKEQAPWELEPITVGALLSPHPLSIYAADPASAKVVDENFREALVGLKQLVSASAELRGKETFDL